MGTRTDDRSAVMNHSTLWDATRLELGLVGEVGSAPDSNIGRLATTRHVDAGRGTDTAIRWFGQDDATGSAPIDISYDMLDHRTSRFAGGLRQHGIEVGASVATVMGRIPELYVVALGALKAGCVFTPLASGAGPGPLAECLSIGDVRVLVTTPIIFRRTIAGVLDRLPDLELVLIVGATEDSLAEALLPGPDLTPTVMSFGVFISEGHDTFEAAPTPPDAPALLHFASGRRGERRGMLHAHDAVVAQVATAATVLDLGQDNVYWCTADPGSAASTSYGIIAPLVLGVTAIVDEAEFDARRLYGILADQSVEVLYTDADAVRMLQRNGSAVTPASFDRLRLVATFGEPLVATSVRWATEVFGVPVVDTWWQIETGAIMMSNGLGDSMRPGAMGQPVPGIDVALLECDADGRLDLDPDGGIRFVDDVQRTGEIVLRVGWPSMFRAYLDRDEDYRSCFVGDHGEWYRTGDLARRNADGCFWFAGRCGDA